MAEEDIRRYTLDDLKKMHERGETFPTPPDAPTYELDEEFWANARIVEPGEFHPQVKVAVDREVYDWFRSQGDGQLARINDILRAYIDAHHK